MKEPLGWLVWLASVDVQMCLRSFGLSTRRRAHSAIYFSCLDLFLTSSLPSKLSVLFRALPLHGRHAANDRQPPKSIRPKTSWLPSVRCSQRIFLSCANPGTTLFTQGSPGIALCIPRVSPAASRIARTTPPPVVRHVGDDACDKARTTMAVRERKVSPSREVGSFEVGDQRRACPQPVITIHAANSYRGALSRGT